MLIVNRVGHGQYPHSTPTDRPGYILMDIDGKISQNNSNNTNKIRCRGAQWISGRASDSGARGRGSKPTSAMLCP